MADFEGLFKATSRRTKAVRVCLRGDLSAEYEALEGRLAVAEAAAADSFDGGGTRGILAELEAMRGEMAAAEVTFTFAALPPMRPLDLVMEHPPRPDDRADKALGYNQATYYPALVRESCVSVTAPDGTTAAAGDVSGDAWDSMLAGLGHLDFDTLVSAAMEANGRTTVPFSRAASQTSQSSGAGSRPRKRGTSPRSGSKAGNPSGSQSSSTTTAGD